MNQWNQLVNKWQKYLYHNQKYCVIAPVTPQEIENEGSILKHCVRSYLRSVYDGLTTILFIRKLDEPDIPYFTAEVNTDDEIVQIKGLENASIDTAYELVAFVKEWAEEKNLKLNRQS